MTPQFAEAIKLMIVGMATVFVILFIVIQLGKLLICIVNKVAPEETSAAPKTIKTQSAQPVDTATMAVINQAVAQITDGKGRVSAVRRV